MSVLKCVIFDMDGTLTQTHQLIFDAFNHIAERYEGRTYAPHEITAMFGPPEEGALLRIVGEARLDSAMKEYLDFYRSHHSDSAKLYPGILDLLRWLKDRGVRLALFTGKGIHTTTTTLELFGIAPYFDFVVTGNDVMNHKPSSEGIDKILHRFNLKADEVLMVGDSPGDAIASRGAGVKIAAVLWDSHATQRVLEMKTDYVFHDVTEFSSWLRGQFE